MGILTVFSATGTAGRFLKEVVRLRKAPDILLALNSELVDLQMLVQSVHDLLQQHYDALGQKTTENLVRPLERARASLANFESLLAYDLTVIRHNHNRLELDKSRWIRTKARVKQVKDDIQNNKTDLSLALNVLTR